MQQVDLDKHEYKRKNVEGQRLYDKGTIPKIRESAYAAVKGVKQGLPVPEFEESLLQEKIALALDKIKESNNEEISEEELIKLVEYVYDVLDDGKRNYSRALSPRMTRIITIVFSFVPITAYAIYALITGDFSLRSLINIF